MKRTNQTSVSYQALSSRRVSSVLQKEQHIGQFLIYFYNFLNITLVVQNRTNIRIRVNNIAQTNGFGSYIEDRA